MDNKELTLLDNWIGWLQARIPALKESNNVYWLKQAMGGYKSENEQYFPKDAIPTHAEIAQVEPVAPIDKTLSAEQYVRRLYPLSQTFSKLGVINIADDYANLRVEQAKEECRKQNNDILIISMNAASNNYFYADAIMTSNSIEEAREKVKINVKFLNDGN